MQKEEKIHSSVISAHKEFTLRGIPSSPGIAFGKALVLINESISHRDEKIDIVEIQGEKDRFLNALNNINQEYEELKERVRHDESSVSSIIESNLLILNDPLLKEAICNYIESGKSAENSVIKEIEKQKDFFKKSKDSLLRERAAELEHLKQRFLSALRRKSGRHAIKPGSIVVAQSVSTSDMIHYRDAKVAAIVTEVGGIASHTSILARSFEIPAVIGITSATKKISAGDEIIVDGFTGRIFTNPGRKTKSDWRTRKQDADRHKEELGALIKLSAVTTDGKSISLQSNADTLEDVKNALSLNSEGFGLVRSESLMLYMNHIPNWEEQYKQYSKIANMAYPRPVTIRVFDFGSDKPHLEYPYHENNPALGFRGIRFLLQRQDIFKTQLRAILGASVNKNIRLMLPMISNVDEVQHSLEIIEKCKQELRDAHIEFDNNIPVGVMIETPAAVHVAKKLAEITSFFSIGTNDLTQYAIAADRTNEMVADVYDPFHPAIIHMIKMTVDAAHKNHIPVSICGELAGHSAATQLLIGLGVDEFSVAPSTLLETKHRIRNTSFEKALQLTKRVLNSSTHEEIRIILDLN